MTMPGYIDNPDTYADGIDAFKQGARPDDNPHPIGSEAGQSWSSGYWSAHILAHFKEKGL